MNFIITPISGLYIVDFNKLRDERGLFARSFCKKEFAEIGLNKEFVQFNHSLTNYSGTIRGMHYQNEPHQEYKLIRCVRGRVFDVAVDLRRNSPTFLKYFSIELSEDNMLSILIPEGFAHGFQVLEDKTSLIYHHTEYYHPESEDGLRFDDPFININWPLPVTKMSDRDKNFSLIKKEFKGL